MNHTAIAELFGQHYPSSLRLARGILRSEEESQDAVQSAYLSAFQHIDSFRGEAAFKTWITRIVLNHCFMQLRRAGRLAARSTSQVALDDRNSKPADNVFVAKAPSPEEAASRSEMAELLDAASSRLPRHLRDVFHLSEHADLSLKEVASALGLTVGGTKTRLFRARARMRTYLQPYVGSPRRPMECQKTNLVCQ